MSNEWIPIADAMIASNKRYHVTWTSGGVSLERGYVIEDTSKIIAVMEYVEPEPYVPPKPKRREYKLDQWGNALPCGAGIGKGVHVLEVFPGDPDPDVVLEVIAEMKTQSETHVISTLLAREWISRLEGEA
jgi:hypothetical protein